MTDQLFLRHVKRLIEFQDRLKKAHRQNNLSAILNCEREINMLSRSIKLYIDNVLNTDKTATRL